ncbi:MAG TPA: peptide cleavage/export ABC transporter, partial [Clostridia bacterium]
IARALLKKPDILIMDEATSNLDSITEKAIERTINELTKGITTIIIAHRLSTIMRCDRIYVMDNGEIVECGTHSELMTKKGMYFDLWKEQLPEYSSI